MRLIALLALLLPSMALAQVTIGPGAHTGPRILGEASTEYCPMLTHGKCTDGKTVTTTRSTPVPCGSGTAGVDVGCYQGGQEIWPQTVNHWLNSREPEKWSVVAGSPVVVGNTVTDNSASVFAGLRAIATGATGAWTASCDVSSGTIDKARLRVSTDGTGGGSCLVSGLTAERRTVHCSGEVGGTPTYVQGVIEVGNLASDTGSIVVHRCQLERSPSVGRPCDAGAIPTTCDSDKPRRSPEGWPLTRGSVSLRVKLLGPLTENAWLLDGREGEANGVNPYIQTDGRLRFRVGGTVHGSSSPLLAWGSEHLVTFRRIGSQTVVYRDGVEVYRATTSDWAWGTTVHIGRNYSGAAMTPVRISRLEWSNQ